MGRPVMSDASVRPAIAGPIVSSIRSILAGQGSWAEVKRTFALAHPGDADWLDEPTWSLWVDLDRHVGMLDAAGEVLGLEGVREVGRRRVTEELRTGIFASIVRSWVRSFAEHPSYLLRVAPYLWRAGFRDCGEMVLVDHQDHMLRYHVAGAPEQILESEAWGALIEGFAQGLFELAQVRGTIRMARAEGRTDLLELEGAWGA